MIGILLYMTALRSTSDSKQSYTEDSYLLSNKDGSNSPSFGVKKPRQHTTSFTEKNDENNHVSEQKTELGHYQRAILEPLESSPAKDQDPFSVSKEWSRDQKSSRVSSVDGEYLDSEEKGFWDSTKHLLRWSTINLVIAMWSCAVFPALFTTLGPMFIGILLPDKRYVALFGIATGVGEIGGSLLAGKVVSKIGIKKSAVQVAVIVSLSIFLSALVFPLKADLAPTISPSPALFIFLGVCLGSGDASHGVILSTLIGRVYKEFSQAGFAVYSLMFNVAAITLYLFSSYCEFEVVIWLMVAIVCSTLIAILLLRKSEITAEEEYRS